MLKIEGENRLDIEQFVRDLADIYSVPDKVALRWLCVAMQYDAVHTAIVYQVNYLLEQNVLTR